MDFVLKRCLQVVFDWTRAFSYTLWPIKWEQPRSSFCECGMGNNMTNIRFRRRSHILPIYCCKYIGRDIIFGRKGIFQIVLKLFSLKNTTRKKRRNAASARSTYGRRIWSIFLREPKWRWVCSFTLCFYINRRLRGRRTHLGARMKNDVSRRADEQRRISARRCRTTYLGARMKNHVPRREDEERRISARGWRTTYFDTLTASTRPVSIYIHANM